MKKYFQKCALIFIGLCFLVFVFIQYTNYQYNLSEHEANKKTVDDCILSSIAFALADYYKQYGYYPKLGDVNSFIWKAGYPSNLGCGPTSVKSPSNIVDTNGNEFIYKYNSPEAVKIYFNESDNKPTAYILSNGDIKASKDGTKGVGEK